MAQRDLPLKGEMVAVDTVIVERQPDMTAAILLCQQVGGLEDKQVASALGMDPAQWSRIKTGSAHFPQDRLGKFMDACANEAPLIWLATRRGYALTPLETELERRLRTEREARERVEAENRLLRDLLVGRQTA